MTVLRTLDPALLIRLTRQEAWSRTAETNKAAPSRASKRTGNDQEVRNGAAQLVQASGKDPVPI
ncbi:hypothetical protein [Fodinicurvata fenggangensis]|uniref:hypothetical protein n=1 Tax=Fodinicurvata fenggangensis TaxID=1121830 RepID=UPI0012DFD8B4|nr:hypothetical protein [Fodinicurvata fenggangensis]